MASVTSMLNLGGSGTRQEFRRPGRIHCDLTLEVAVSLRGVRYARTPTPRLDTALSLPRIVAF